MPNRMNLTQLGVERLRPGDKEVIFWDLNMPGFGLRVSPKGRKTFIVQYRVRGTKGGKWVERQEALGTLADLKTVAKARELARERRLKAREGVDPVVERKATEQAEKIEQAALSLTFTKLADRFQTEYADRETRASSATETRRLLARWSKVLGDRPVNDIVKADIVTFLNDYLASKKDGKGRVEGNHFLMVVRHLFSWGKQHDLVTSNPAEDVPKPLNKVPTRDRILTDDEIRGFWVGCDSFGWPGGRLLQLLLLTAQREGEVSNMKWSELDLANRVWNIPAERAKNGKAHTVYLNDLAIEIIRGLPQINGSEFVFTHNGDKPLVNFAAVKRSAERAMGCSDWRIHDLRRTATTLMARLGIAPHVADKVLNHQSGTIRGVAAVYNRFEYLDERKAALETLGRFIAELIGRDTGNVVPLRSVI